MKITSNHLQRYKQIAMLLWKYGRSDLVKQMELDDTMDPGTRDNAPSNPEQAPDPGDEPTPTP